MEAIFEHHREECATLISEIELNLANALNGDKSLNRQNAKRIKAQIDEALELIEQMEVDVYELRSAERNEASADVKEFKKTVERFRTELVKITAKNGDNEANRAALLGNRANGRDYSLEYENGRDQHSHLLDGSDALHSAGYRLQESHRLAVEAEAVGSNILNDLRSQREQIVHSRNRMFDIDFSIGNAEHLVDSMLRSLTRNKVLAYCVGGFVILLFLIVIIIKIYK